MTAPPSIRHFLPDQAALNAGAALPAGVVRVRVDLESKQPVASGLLNPRRRGAPWLAVTDIETPVLPAGLAPPDLHYFRMEYFFAEVAAVLARPAAERGATIRAWINDGLTGTQATSFKDRPALISALFPCIARTLCHMNAECAVSGQSAGDTLFQIDGVHLAALTLPGWHPDTSIMTTLGELRAHETERWAGARGTLVEAEAGALADGRSIAVTHPHAMTSWRGFQVHGFAYAQTHSTFFPVIGAGGAPHPDNGADAQGQPVCARAVHDGCAERTVLRAMCISGSDFG